MVARRLVIVANLVYAIALLLIGLVPKVPVPSVAVPDGLAHAAASAGQTVLLFAVLDSRGRPKRAAAVAAVVAILYCGCVEILQFLQPARTVEVRDLVANMVGAGAAAILLTGVAGSRAGDSG